jgi:putative flippase GtrA
MEKKWTFKSKGDLRRECLKFGSVYGVTFLINLLILALFVEKFMLSPQIGQVFALGIVTMISFLGHKYWSFRLS